MYENYLFLKRILKAYILFNRHITLLNIFIAKNVHNFTKTHVDENTIDNNPPETRSVQGDTRNW